MDQESEKIISEYFDWLTTLVDRSPNGKKYSKMLKCLHENQFKAINIFDRNRQNDARDLRKTYFNSIYYKIYSLSSCPEIILFGEQIINLCTFLELLICISKRMEFEMTSDSDMDYSTNRWFWELISNIGFDKYSDDDWDLYDSEKEIINRINIINNRKYEQNGNGGLFPIHTPPYRMRNMDLWYQMMKYLQEKYDLEDD